MSNSNYMKKILLLGFFLLASTMAAYAQMSSREIEKMASEAAAEMAKEGWKAKVGAKPLKYQLIKLYTMQEELVNGRNKYIISDGQVKGSTLEGARIHAMEVAKRNMISLIDNITVSQSDGDEINADGTANAESDGLSETKYRNTSSLELGNLITVVTCYRQLPGGKVEVLVQLAATMENVVKAKLKKVKAVTGSQNSNKEVVSSHTL